MSRLEFLNELRLQFEKDLDLKKTLDEKASRMITIAGTIVGFLFAFGTFILTRIGTEYAYVWLIKELLIGGIAVGILAILFATLASQLKKYRYVMGHEIFYNKDGSRNKDKITEYADMDVSNFQDKMIKEYLQSINENSKTNHWKATTVILSQWSFIGSIVTTLVLIIIMIHAFGVGAISLH